MAVCYKENSVLIHFVYLRCPTWGTFYILSAMWAAKTGSLWLGECFNDQTLQEGLWVGSFQQIPEPRWSWQWTGCAHLTGKVLKGDLKTFQHVRVAGGDIQPHVNMKVFIMSVLVILLERNTFHCCFTKLQVVITDVVGSSCR